MRSRVLTVGALVCSLAATGIIVWLQSRSEDAKESERFERAVARIRESVSQKTSQVGTVVDAMCVFNDLDANGNLGEWPKLARTLRPALDGGGVVWTGFLERRDGGPPVVASAGQPNEPPTKEMSSWQAILDLSDSPNREALGLVSAMSVGVVHVVNGTPGTRRWAAVEVDIGRFVGGLRKFALPDQSEPWLRMVATSRWQGTHSAIYSSAALEKGVTPRFKRSIRYPLHLGEAGVDLSTTMAFHRARDRSAIILTLVLGVVVSLLITVAVHAATNKSDVDMYRIRAAADTVSSAVCICDQSGRPVYANPAFVEMFGEIAADRNLSRVLGEGLPRDVRAALASGTEWKGEIRAKDKSGRFRDLALRIQTVRSPLRTALGWMADVTDISERKQIEQTIVAARAAALEASRVKSALQTNLSHEIRTPLNGVVGMLSLLEMSKLDAEQREYVSLAEGSAKSLMTVINDVLDFSKIEAGCLDLDLTDFDLPELLRQVARAIGLPANAKGTKVSVEIGEGVPRTYYGDAARFRQVVQSLMSNAVKFTCNGTVTLRASVNGQHLRIDVIDTGIGVRAEVVPRLFTPFMQADQSTSRKFGGTGLGLAICRQLVELMGGEVGVETKEGNGSTFWVELPLTPQKLSQVASV
jgi:PAS domain S-box-containing protein